jgi:hypothetical protein
MAVQQKFQLFEIILQGPNKPNSGGVIWLDKTGFAT